MAYPPQGPPPQSGYGQQPVSSPQPGYGPPGYGPPGYGYGPPQQEHPQGTTVMVLGLVGIVACQLASPFAWVMGNKALAEIDAAPHLYSNRSNVQVGRICGIVGSVILGVSLVFVVLWLVVAFGSIAASAT